ESNPPKNQLAKLYNNIGVAYSNKGLYKKSRHYYQLELKVDLAVKGKNHPDIAGVYLNLGNNYLYSGDAREAHIYFKKNSRIIQNVYGRNHSMMAFTLNSMAECEIKLKNYSQAIDHLKDST